MAVHFEIIIKINMEWIGFIQLRKSCVIRLRYKIKISSTLSNASATRDIWYKMISAEKNVCEQNNLFSLSRSRHPSQRIRTSIAFGFRLSTSSSSRHIFSKRILFCRSATLLFTGLFHLHMFCSAQHIWFGNYHDDFTSK